MDWPCSVCRVDAAAIVVGLSTVAASALVCKILQLIQRRRRCAPLHPAGVGRCVLSFGTLLVLLLSLAEALLRRLPARSGAATASAVASILAWLATEVLVTVSPTRNARLLNAGFATALGVVSLSRAISTSACAAATLHTCAAPWLSIFSAVGFASVAVVDFALIKTAASPDPSQCEARAPTSVYAYRHDTSSVYSRATFAWLWPLFRRLGRRNRDASGSAATPPLPPSDGCGPLLERLLQLRRPGTFPSGHSDLWRTCALFCGGPFLLGGLLKLLGDTAALAAPVGLAIVVAHAERAAKSQKDENVELDPYPSFVELFRNGYVASGAMFMCALLQGVLSQASTYLVNVQGLRFKAAMQTLVYRKTLHLPLWSVPDHECDRAPVMKETVEVPADPPNHRDSIDLDEDDGHFPENKQRLGATDSQRSCATSALDSGAITNLMTEDTFNIMSFIWIAHYIWAIPLKIGVLLILLYFQLGICALAAGALCIAIMAPLQLFLGRRMSADAEAAAEAADERLRRVADALRGARILKLFGWEGEWEQRVGQARDAELMRLDSESTSWAIMTFLTHASSVLVALAAFGLRALLVDEPLTAPDVFAGLALFNQLTVPLFIFPVTVPLAISAMVSMRRLEGFLDLPELKRVLPQRVAKPPRPAQYAPPSLQTIQMSGQFSWGGLHSVSAAALCVDKITIPQGRLTLVVGSVGSGKSSLLAALLGEMRSLVGSDDRGTVQWPRPSSAALCTQRPWLQSASVRENILFGQPMRRRAYTRALVACALQPDLAILPDGDHTVVGDGGVSLSGGQCARVALARAIYAGATGSSAADVVVLLDDPLAPLDPAVATHVWQKGVLRLLLRRGRGHVAKRSATVIMATHCLPLLPDADHKTATDLLEAVSVSKRETLRMRTLTTTLQPIIVLDSGRVRAQGTLGDIMSRDSGLARIWRRDIGHLPNFPYLSTISCQEDKTTAPLKAPGTPRGERTARERWQLLRTVSRVGLHGNEGCARPTPGAGNAEDNWATSEQRRASVRRRPAVFHDLPLPVDECDNAEMSTGGSVNVWRQTSDCDSSSAAANDTSQTENTPSNGHRRVSRVGRLSRLSIRCGLRAKSKRLANGRVDLENGGVKSRKISAVSGALSTNASISSSSTSLHSHNTKERRESCVSAGPRNASHPAGSASSEPLSLSYVSYARACGASAAVTYVLSTLLWQAFRLRTDWWLSRWADGHKEGTTDKEAWSGVRTFALLSAATLVLSLVSSLSGQVSGARARRVLHRDAVSAVLRCSARHLDSQPIGSLMACFCGDVSAIDRKLATSMQRLAQFFLLCCSALLANALLSPWFLLAALPACVCYYTVQHVYRTASRKLQHLEASTRSATLSLFTDSVRGLATLRAFGQQQRFLDAMTARMDAHHSAGLLLNAANRWLGVALDGLGAAVVLVSSTGALLAADAGAAAAGVGLAVNYTLLVPVYLTWVVKLAADVELYFGSLDRLRRYCMLPQEDFEKGKDLKVNETWPETGEIQFEDVCLQHGDNSEPVIKSLNFFIPAGQRVGICGRTGSGKSSLVMSLFRMMELRSGRVLVDKTDVSKVSLQTLRSRLAVVPQDAVLFSGTVRDNLDPCNKYSDAELWRCLEVAQLEDMVRALPCALGTTLRDAGDGLSAGTRQLLCVARAALRGTRVVVLDEATSALDAGAEKIFLEATRTAFSVGRTVLVVAHRPAALLDCDRVVVLEGGQIVEDGEPSELLERPGGSLRALLAAAE